MVNLGAWRPVVTAAPPATVNQPVTDPFERLFLREYSKLVGIAYRVLADRQSAEDVAQEVFLKFHRLHSPDAGYASGWLHAAAVHSALNRLRGDRRRALRENAHALERQSEMLENPETLAERSELRNEVRTALARLPQKSAALLALRYSGLSYAEVAAALRLKVGNIGTMLRRAESALRKEVEDASSR
jgi:RNA polymerase sigma-70 factor (ECF subfamily)